MGRCLDEGGVLAFHDTVSLWVLDSVRFALLAIAAHLPLPGHEFKLSEGLDEHKIVGSDDAKKVDFLAVKHLEWRLHLKRLVRGPVLEVCSRHEHRPSYGRWNAAACEHAPNHDAQSSPHALRYTHVLRCVGGGELLDNTGLQVVLPKLLSSVVAALVRVPTNDAAAKEKYYRADEQLE